MAASLSVHRMLLFMVLGFVAVGCDQSATDAPVVSTKALFVELTQAAALLPAEPTHLAVDAQSRPYFVQELDTGNEIVFTVKGDQVAPTGLCSATIAAAAGAPNAGGHIESIAAGGGADSWVYFFYCGADGPRPLILLGRYSPDAGNIQILASAAQIAGLSRLGPSTAIARGKLMLGGASLWLWLHHDDDGDFLRMNLDIPPGQTPRLARAFAGVKTDGDSFRANRTNLDIAAAADGSLTALDPWSGAVWSIDAVGDGRIIEWISGISQSLSAPFFDSLGRTVFFVGDGDAAPSNGIFPARDPIVVSDYPSLVFTDGASHTILGPASFRAGEGVVVHDLQIRTIVPEPSPDAWLAYDSLSGQMLHVRLISR